MRVLSHITWKLGGIIILPAGTCRTIFSPSNSQRSHLDWLISRAQGSSSISRVLTYGFQTDSFTRIGLSHWLSCSFLFQITHPSDSLKHDEFRIYEACLSIPDTQCSRRIPWHATLTQCCICKHKKAACHVMKLHLMSKDIHKAKPNWWHQSLEDACKWSSSPHLLYLAQRLIKL